MVFWSQDVGRIKPFSIMHLSFLIFALAILALFFLNAEHIKRYKKKYMSIIFVFILLAQSLKYTWYAIEMNFDISESLPLHLCRITLILYLIFIVTEYKPLRRIIYFFSFYVFISLFYPDNVHPFYHTIGITYMADHLMGSLIPLVLITLYDYKPTIKDMKISYLVFTIIVIIIWPLNKVLDSNYFYIERKPLVPMLSDIQFIGIFLLVTLLIFILAKYVGDLILNIKSKEV